MPKKFKLSIKSSYNVEEKTVNNNIWTFPAYVSKNKKGTNVMSATFDYVNDGKTQYIKETYHLTMVSGRKGEIIYSSTYPEASTTGVVTSKIQPFTILGVSGCFKDIKYVVMDFSDKVRKIYMYKEK